MDGWSLVPHPTKRRWLALLGVLSVLALVLVGRWLNATKIGGQQPSDPCRIAGNFHYVGANDVSAAGPAELIREKT